MKVLQINNHHRIIGGSDMVYFNTSQLLARHGHEVVPFASRSNADLYSDTSDYFPRGLQTEQMRPRDLPRYLYNIGARRALSRLVDRMGQFDVAHLHIYYGRLTSSILPELKHRGIPTVQSLHEYKLACPIYTMERNGQTCEACIEGSTLNLLRHRCKSGSLLHSAVALTEHWISRLGGDVRLIDRFICISDFQLNLMRRAGIPAEKLRRIHNFVEPSAAHVAAPGEKESYLLYFGRIEALKGVSTLIEAVKRTGQELRIAGAGNWEPQMREAIEGFSNIRHLGFVSGAPLKELIARAKAVIVPSEWYEPFGMTVIEAKAAGTPVVGARIGGIPELLRDEVDGLLFTPGDPDALATALRRLDEMDLEAAGAAARADVLARFSPEAHLAALLATYSEVTSQRSPQLASSREQISDRGAH